MYPVLPEVTCGDPGTPVNGQRVLEDTTFDATVTYSCSEGYVLVGEKERQCGSDGQWSGPLPRCDRKLICSTSLHTLHIHMLVGVKCVCVYMSVVMVSTSHGTVDCSRFCT